MFQDMFQPTEYLLQAMTCALSGKGIKRLPWDRTFMFLVFVFDNIRLYFCMYYYVVHPHTQYIGTMLQQGF